MFLNQSLKELLNTDFLYVYVMFSSETFFICMTICLHLYGVLALCPWSPQEAWVPRVGTVGAGNGQPVC